MDVTTYVFSLSSFILIILIELICIYLFINYNTITNYILIIYKLSNLDHVLSVVSQARVSDGNQTHDPHTNSLAHYQGTQYVFIYYKQIQQNVVFFSQVAFL